MKIPIVISLVVIAAAAGILGWRAESELGQLRATRDQLSAKLAASGFLHDPAHPTEPPRGTRRGRVDKVVETEAAIGKLIGLLDRKMPEGGPIPVAENMLRMRNAETLTRTLDSAQLRQAIAALLAAPDLAEEDRQMGLLFAIPALARTHPLEALGRFTQTVDAFTNVDLSHVIIEKSLANFAKIDPLAAAEWAGKNQEKYPRFINPRTYSSLYEATQDRPELAFKMIDILGIQDPVQAAGDVMSYTKTPQERTAAVAALRGYAATLTDENQKNAVIAKGLISLLNSVRLDGFDSGSHWLESSGLSEAELSGFAEKMYCNPSLDDNGPWIEWAATKLPPEQSSEKVRYLVGTWTREDYQSPSKWLATLAEGPVKSAATQAYVERVAEYRPEAAEQWAMTLPAGEERERTLRQIYQNLPRKDPAAKAAFAKEHGIE
ncbi:MAG: hypothetical protein V4689_16225 [Verrucomicrobiota bacterium]